MLVSPHRSVGMYAGPCRHFSISLESNILLCCTSCYDTEQSLRGDISNSLQLLHTKQGVNESNIKIIM